MEHFMSLRRFRSLAVALLLLPSLALHAGPRPTPRGRCPPAPEGGSLACGARCMSFHLGSYCDSSVEPRPPATAYCYQVLYIGDVTSQSCHDGEYDQCCDPNAVY